MFRSKKMDLGCFINIKVIRDHTKRKVYAGHETERYAFARPRPQSKIAFQHPLGDLRLSSSPGAFLLMRPSQQASPSICHPQPEPPSTNPRRRPTRIDPDALLHTSHPDSQSLYNGRKGKRYSAGFQDVKGTFGRISRRRLTARCCNELENGHLGMSGGRLADEKCSTTSESML